MKLIDPGLEFLYRLTRWIPIYACSFTSQLTQKAAKRENEQLKGKGQTKCAYGV